ncbi:3'-5' exonuclease [Gnomoniopsis smithogilvyi]|uniref:RNA exonuclease 4 n=1 Tax=Gnomoniopsis smithogilvyi TaxID=1191159 RepID=A0A9W9CW14_9PEZI|nr:3'-5' exonuclease [Gnomoniopsis smithogilvyi]
MAPELSSNWKKLQAKIKQEPTKTQGQKRKANDDEPTHSYTKPTKKAKVISTGTAQRSKSQTVAQSKPAAKPRMGAVQSQTSKPGMSASLALWAEDHDISPESISEAYGLGSKNNSMLTATAVRPNEGLAPDLEVGKYIAIDCEMVGIGEGGYEHALARVSIVDFHGRQIYDSYVRPKERVVDWRTRISGITPKHMATARDFEAVQLEVANLLQGRIIVGHDLRHDLDVLILDHPRKDIRDTARFSGFKKYGHGPKPALRVLAREILGVEIQTGQHSSIEDARVAMLLFRKYKPAFDVEHAARYPEPVSRTSIPKSKPKQKKTKKKRRN